MDVHFHINLRRPQWTRNWSLRRKVMVFLALTLVLMPAAIFATNDIFTDVPSGNAFHDDINAIYGARITAGTSPGLYSPGLNVNREQMAAFLHRGLPRVAYNSLNAYSLLTDEFQSLAVVTINTGGAPGGMGFVKLDASLITYTSGVAGCPCEMNYIILRDSGGNSIDSYVTVYNAQGGVDSSASGALTWAVPVPTASTQTFRLLVKKTTGTADVYGLGALTALYVPFGATGGNTLDPPAMAAQAVSEHELKARTNKNNK